MAGVNIEVRENGSLRFVGPITITDKDGKNYTVPEGKIVSFCRCGHSTNKPFCTGEHRAEGFEADSSAY
ncbi:MAG: CDGSH iron-sulfur domain-containing protein [Dehalococcoidia bacterium]|jgi:CDGSH-type Zn-finger protein|nr:CDGSH iron-sulfur domain-containing protein [Dehalococcoidia bacterium]|tara:strand:- start:2679 stop:2885 length:207 start_codon:yes stop_codon:yes gene_type:complete